MNTHRVLEAWQVDADATPHVAEHLASQRVYAPDTRLIALGRARGRLTAQLVSGAPPLGTKLYVAGCGLYEVTQSECWPASNETQRVMLTLAQVSA